jgi:hypothetical protein
VSSGAPAVDALIPKVHHGENQIAWTRNEVPDRPIHEDQVSLPERGTGDGDRISTRSRVVNPAYGKRKCVAVRKERGSVDLPGGTGRRPRHFVVNSWNNEPGSNEDFLGPIGTQERGCYGLLVPTLSFRANRDERPVRKTEDEKDAVFSSVPPD